MFVELLDHGSLCCFSLANSTCNDIANRRLWRSVSVTGDDCCEVLSILHAISRLPRRAKYVYRLNCGPFAWPWNSTVLDALSRVWSVMSNIQDFRIRPQKDTLLTLTSRKLGINQTPLLRRLVSHGKHLRLRVLEVHTWLRPDSALYTLLASHSTIEELIGVDVFTTRLPPMPSTFLPNIRALRCARQITAELFAKMRAVQSICITQSANLSLRTRALTKAFESCSGPLKEFNVLLPRQYTTHDAMLHLAGSLSTIRALKLRVFDITRLEPDVKFPNLEQLECESSVDHDATAVQLLVKRIGAKNLRRIIIISAPGCGNIPHRVWIKDTVFQEYVFVQIISNLACVYTVAIMCSPAALLDLPGFCLCPLARESGRNFWTVSMILLSP